MHRKQLSFRCIFFVLLITTATIPSAVCCLSVSNFFRAHLPSVTTVHFGLMRRRPTSATFIASIASKMPYSTDSSHNIGNALSRRYFSSIVSSCSSLTTSCIVLMSFSYSSLYRASHNAEDKPRTNEKSCHARSFQDAETKKEPANHVS